MKTISSLLLLLALMCHCASYGQNRWIEDSQMNFKIQVPSNYQTNQFWDGSDKIHAFLSPDQNVAIRVRSFALPNNVTINNIIQAFTRNVINGAIALVSEKYTLNGMEGQLAGYRWKYNNINVIIAAFYTIQNNYGYIVWTMIPENLFAARNAESDAITNSFSLISTPIATTDQPVPEDTPLKYIRTVSASPPVIISNLRIGGETSQDIDYNTTEIHLKANFQGNLKESPLLVKWFSKTHKCLIAEEYHTPTASDLQVLHSFIDNTGEQWPAGDYFVQVWHYGHKVAENEFSVKQPGQKPTNLLGTMFADGSGDNKTKSKGGRYLSVPLDKLNDNDILELKVTSGNLKNVHVHLRTSSGVWYTKYNGLDTKFRVADLIENQRDRFTHFVFCVNGQHEKYLPIACYAELFINTQSGTANYTASKPVTTTPAIKTGVKQIILDNTYYAYDFATGKTRSTYEPEPDVMNRPWCTDLPALSGNWARTGKSRMEDVVSPPATGYISDGKSFIDVQEAPLNEVLVFKLSNGKFAKLMIIKDEKSQTGSGCQHKITCLVQYPAF